MSRLLTIAPEPELLEALQAAPALDGCEIEQAHGNVDALLRLARRSYDVVLTDPRTHVNEDLALVSETRRIRPGLRVIVLAPEAARSELVAALRARVFATFCLPLRLEEVIGMTARALVAVDWQAGIEVSSAVPDWIQLGVSCAQVNAERLIRFAREMNRDVPDADRNELLTAFREMLLNAMEHGAGFDPEKTIDVSAIRTDRAIVYFFRDPGPGFQLAQVPHAAVNNPPEEPLKHADLREKAGMRPGGFGILLARGLVDEVRYNEHGNCVLLIKHTQ